MKPIVIQDKNKTGGWTDMGPALEYSIDIAIDEWKRLKSQGVPVFIPWIILFTDGKPENKERNAEEKLRKAAAILQSYEYPQKRTDKLLYIGIGVGDNVDTNIMRSISAHGKIRYLHAKNFSMLPTLFQFVGATTVTGVGQEAYQETERGGGYVFQQPKSDRSETDNWASNPSFTPEAPGTGFGNSPSQYPVITPSQQPPFQPAPPAPVNPAANLQPAYNQQPGYMSYPEPTVPPTIPHAVDNSSLDALLQAMVDDAEWGI